MSLQPITNIHSFSMINEWQMGCILANCLKGKVYLYSTESRICHLMNAVHHILSSTWAAAEACAHRLCGRNLHQSEYTVCK